jgi:hypothetical protein
VTKCFVISLIMGSVFLFNGHAQSSADTSFLQKSIQNTIQLYRQFLGKEAGLYNGPEYESYPFRFQTGQPFFSVDSFVVGNLQYDGLDYFNVFLKYDLVRDELILRNHDGFNKINLIKDRVNYFEILDHRFVRITPDSSIKSNPPQGFYDLLHNGSVQFLAKRTKTVQQTIPGLVIEYHILSKDHFYLFKDGVYHKVRNKKTLLEYLKDKRANVQQFIRANNIRFKKNFEPAAILVLAHYDQTTK